MFARNHGLIAEKAPKRELVFFSHSVLVWPQVIESEESKSMNFFFGTTEIQALRAEQPSACRIKLEDVQQDVDSFFKIVDGRLANVFRLPFCVLK